MVDTTSLDLLNQTQIELLQKYDGAFSRLDEKANELVGVWQSIADEAEAQIETTNELVEQKLQWAESEINTLKNELPSVMFRTFYVDAENGDDSNDGTEGAPFKTIKKACDSVPVGGVGEILLTDSQTFVIDSDINVSKKYIYIRSQTTSGGAGDIGNDSRAIIQFKEWRSDTYRGLFGFHSITRLGFEYVHLYIPSSENISLNTMVYKRSAVRFSVDSLQEIKFSRCTIKNESDYWLLAGWENYPGSFHLSTFEAKYIVNSVHKIQFRLDNYGTAKIGVNTTNVSVVDENGNGYSFKDIISGVIKDANGVPRNVISNIIL